ncbi:DUF2642 domain-containing protein [Laceyella putida]|uniref:DUF2642 domain-containing protein n=2 Tax=Laceyella putida TaxID=110101 RepID=A0ABW2RKZ6_9BACL
MRFVGEEEVFLYHLREMKGRYVKVAMKCKSVKGILRDVFPDHILVVTRHREYHIRLKTICYVSPLAEHYYYHDSD